MNTLWRAGGAHEAHPSHRETDRAIHDGPPSTAAAYSGNASELTVRTRIPADPKPIFMIF